MKLVMIATAKKEFIEAILHYNSVRESLGFEFASNVKNSISHISASPDSWPKFSERLRRYILKRFPYAIIYRFENNQITIIAIMHMKRDHKRWQDQK